jgi:hypothetical protein
MSNTHQAGGIPTHWIGRLLGTHYLVTAALAGALVYLIGLTIAGFTHVSGRFVHSPPTASLAFLAAWVLAFGAWSTKHTQSLPKETRGAFDETRLKEVDAEFDWGTFQTGWLRKLHGSLFNAILTLVLLALMLAAHFGTHGTRAFLDGPDRAGTHSIFVWYALVGAPLAAAMTLGFAMYTYFAWRVTRFHVVRELSIARTRLRPLVEFGLWTGFGWAVAVLTIALTFHNDQSRFLTVFLVVLALLGTCLLVYPQFAAQRALSRERDEMLVEIGTPLLLKAGAGWVGDLALNPDPDTAKRREFIAALEGAPTMVHRPEEIALLISEILIPVATAVVAIVRI